MGQAYITRRGGQSMAVRLMAIASAEELPGSALKNTLAVVTERGAERVYMRSERPEAPQEGDIWAASGGSEGFAYCSSRADVLIGILHVEQYIGGEWKRVAAYAWIDGGWVQVSTEKFMLYERGTDMTDVTGGWGSKKDAYGRITWNEDSLYLGYAEAAGGRYASVYTESRIDLTQYTKLCILASDVNVGNGFIFGAAAEPYTGVSTTDAAAAMAAYISLTKDAAEENVYEVDISALGEGYHVQLAVGVSEATVHEIYLC